MMMTISYKLQELHPKDSKTTDIIPQISFD
jgi:hypothetical protein